MRIHADLKTPSSGGPTHTLAGRDMRRILLPHSCRNSVTYTPPHLWDSYNRKPIGILAYYQIAGDMSILFVDKKVTERKDAACRTAGDSLLDPVRPLRQMSPEVTEGNLLSMWLGAQRHTRNPSLEVRPGRGPIASATRQRKPSRQEPPIPRGSRRGRCGGGTLLGMRRCARTQAYLCDGILTRRSANLSTR